MAKLQAKCAGTKLFWAQLSSKDQGYIGRNQDISRPDLHHFLLRKAKHAANQLEHFLAFGCRCVEVAKDQVLDDKPVTEWHVGWDQCTQFSNKAMVGWDTTLHQAQISGETGEHIQGQPCTTSSKCPSLGQHEALVCDWKISFPFY